ncbi:hypothetical protein [Corynebacterium anserum]|uniref:Secreted protein n=1 Tax=Corynebacterium anserum TaxID=2684406 RepID=A0A7G7YQN5_9CORY|nr:hypothetical protein [Corynebacterium anserum]QNH96805.1 hypothetical protein GP473_09260 [Corynebacterium anserum]
MIRSARPARAPRRALAAALTAAALVTVSAVDPTEFSGVAASAHAQGIFAQATHPPADFTANDPESESGREIWENVQARSTDPNLGVELSLSSLDATSDSTTATLSVRNSTPHPISSLSLRVMYQPPAGSASAVRTAQLANHGEYPAGSPSMNLSGDIPANDIREFTILIRKNQNAAGTAHSADGSVTIPELFTLGSHPVMFALTADVQSAEQPQPVQQLAAVARTTLSVASEKKENTRASELTFIWPLAAETHLLGGGTGEAPKRATLYLHDDDLAGELSEGGRLRMLLDTYHDAVNGPGGDAIRKASCLAIDPELLDTVSRMANGYQVGQQRPSPVEEQKRLRDSWGDLFGSNRVNSTDGTGSEAAKKWIDDLRALVTEGCTVSLPYAGADINTLVNVEQDWLAIHAFAQGPRIINEVLGVWPMQNIVIPDSGYVAPEAVRLLASAATQGINTDLSKRFEAIQQGAPVMPQRADVTAIVADNTVITETPADSQHSTPDDNAPNSTGNSSDSSPETDDTSQGASVETSQNPVASPIVDISSTIPQEQNTKHTARAVTYSGNVGTALRATGAHPEVAAYSNPAQRYNVEKDSPTARMLDATAVINEEINASEPVLAIPPALWTIGQSEAQEFLRTIADNLTSGRAVATPLGDVISGTAGKGRTTIPYTDPGEQSQAQIDLVRNHASYLRDLTLTMRNEAKIALTRETFTRPLYDDLVRATTDYRLRERGAWREVRDDIRQRSTAVDSVVSTLRRSVSLLPPGNVFTRTSNSSPLLVVARNGLPLPVTATVGHTTENASKIDLELPNEAQTIPAKGSITLSLNTSIEGTSNGADTTDLTLWLAAPSGETISNPVELRVQSAPGLTWGSAIGLLILVGGIGVAGKILWDRRTGRKGGRRAQRRTSRPKPLDLEGHRGPTTTN